MEQISVIKFPWLCPLQLTPLYLWLLSQALPAARLLTQTFFTRFLPPPPVFPAFSKHFLILQPILPQHLEFTWTKRSKANSCRQGQPLGPAAAALAASSALLLRE